MSRRKNKQPVNFAPTYADGLAFPAYDLNEYGQKYFYQMTNYALNMFKWNNLPDGIPEKFIERVLCWKGYACFSKAFMDKYSVMECTIASPRDIYLEPTRIHLFAINGNGAFNKDIDADEGVMIYNNYVRMPTAPMLVDYARRMAEVEGFQRVNLNSCKTPLFIRCTRDQYLSVMNAYEKYEGNVPVVFVDEHVDMLDKFQVVNTSTPYLVDKAQVYKKQIWDEAMLFLGIRNLNSEKRERLITAEADGNIQQIEMSRLVMLNARKEACEQINQKFGLNVSVEFRTLINYGDGIMSDVLDKDILKEVNNDAGNYVLTSSGAVPQPGQPGGMANRKGTD